MTDDLQPTEEEIALFRLIADFVNAPDWEASRRLFDQHPDLQSDDTIIALDGMIEGSRQQGDLQKVRVLAIHRDLLRTVKEQGADEAFRRVADGPDPNLLNTIALFINAQNWDESRAVLDDHPELLEMEAAAAFEMLIQTAAAMDDTKRIRLLQTHIDLLNRAREVGADQAFSELHQPFDDALMQVIAAFVYAGSSDASRQVLEQHPQLLEEQTFDAFKTLIRDAQREGETELALLLTLHLDILRKAKEQGIDAAFTPEVDLLPDEDIMQLVVDWVNAEGTEASRAMLEDHPALVSDEALEALNMLIKTAETQERGDMLHHLNTYKQLLEVVREVGIERAFAHVASPDDLLDLIVNTSIDALREDNAELTSAWRAQLGTFNEQATTLGDQNMMKLTQALARLFLGGSADTLDPGLTGKHGEAWDRIAEAKREYS